MSRGKRNYLERGILASLEEARILSFYEFRKVMSIAVETDITEGEMKHRYQNLALHEWIEENEQQEYCE